MTIPVWFDSDTAGEFELVCAELCGWGHYKMRGRVTVHETEAEFQKWIDERLAEQNRSQLTHDDRSRGEMMRMSAEHTSPRSHRAPQAHARTEHGHDHGHEHGHDDHIHPAPVVRS